MLLQNPAVLAWLPLLFGAIILLYLLKMRRRDFRVPATFLWPQRQEEVRANALFDRLRFSWLLVLQLLAIALIWFALSRPQTRQSGLAGQASVIVLDASASMGATDVAPSRFDEARRLAREMIAGARPGDRLALIEAGPVARVIFSLGQDSAGQQRALAKVRRYDAEGSMGEALRLAAALVGETDGSQIVVLSDGVFAPIRDFSPGKASVAYRSVGRSGDNLAISALGTSDTAQGRQVLVSVANTGARPLTGTLTLDADGEAFESIREQISPGATLARTVRVPSGSKVIEARLDAPDALSADNYGAVLADPSSALRVLLVSNGDPFTERALALDPRVTLDRTAALPEDRGAAYDIVVFAGVPELETAARGVLTLGRAGPGSPVGAIGTIRGPEESAREQGPLVQDVDLEGVFIETAERVEPKPGARVWLSAGTDPLLVSADRGGKRQVYLAFQPAQSDFPLQPAFPIFIANALDFLAGDIAGDEAVVAAGRPVGANLPEGGILRTPDGGTAALPAGTNALRNLDRVGRYTIEAGGKTRTIYATFRSESDSRIAPQEGIALGSGAPIASKAPDRLGDFYKPLLLLALLVLACEWWLYARKS